MFRSTISLTRALALVLALVVGPASAQMPLMGAGPGSKGAASPPVATYLASIGSGNSGATQTTSSGTIGSVSYNRTIYVALTNISAVSITSITVTPNIGSAVAATIDISQTSTGPISAIAHANLLSDALTATTCTVTIVYAANPFNGSLVWIYSVPTANISSFTPTGATAPAPMASSTSVTSSVATSNGGFIIALGMSTNGTSNTGTISGTASFTADSQNAGAGVVGAVAHANNVATNASSSVQTTFTQSGTTALAAIAVR